MTQIHSDSINTFAMHIISYRTKATDKKKPVSMSRECHLCIPKIAEMKNGNIFFFIIFETKANKNKFWNLNKIAYVSLRMNQLQSQLR